MKKLITSMLALTLLFSAPGCGNTTPTETPVPSETAAPSLPLESPTPETTAPETTAPGQNSASETDSYAELSESCILAFLPESEFLADLDGDGTMDSISVTGDWDEYDTAVGIQLEVNGNGIYADSYCWAMAPYLIHLADGRNYLYVDLFRENDYHALLVFDLNGETPLLVGEFWNMGFQPSAWADSPSELPTDPSSMLMFSRLEALSTYSGWRTWSVGEDGTPVPNEDWYTALGELTLTSKVALSGQTLSDSLQPTGETLSIPAGTEMTILRTDNESYVDFRIKDGPQVRLEVQLYDWPDRVNGISVEDCFDGTVYAG